MDIPPIRAAQRSEAQQVVAALTVAFASDPIFRYFWTRPSEYLQYVPSFIMAMGERGFDHGTVTVTEDFSAASMWLPPGVVPDPEKLRSLDYPRTPEREEASAELRREIERFHPSEPHWYLWMIGVDPRQQGQGLGSALLKHTLKGCDERGDIAYLESSSPKNVPLYERHGFEVLAVVQVRDVPPVTPMLRAARR